ncbi:uncharacterized protein L969DRAFT_53074 [Mixia osmundae IAM 14324]|uniref:Uncharacterized protein n=1 Tax=Mixia osmundae (strain CBS 9802 / IAM 14324 / JCM 22182 / KY 12970) TaxID=764103 RepID=G7DUV9_MIXOS|nr:uncharacterized protein L969DRAFT_53074 [Mixia osmundae IAM 14324]KEI37414.1 hypothetical protein L969DRAFT_53074 [Mixia osmundae IAM 14324]GAA94369.1 hypothetical protein E5Q_01020 [Mixia osmundae IAM 14324]
MVNAPEATSQQGSMSVPTSVGQAPILPDQMSPATSTEPATAAAASQTGSASAAASALPPDTVAFASRLFECARNGDPDGLLKAALTQGSISNLRNAKGDSFVMLACYHGHVDLARAVLQAGGDPNILNDRGQSPLAGAIFKNENEIVDLLIEHGADPYAGTPTAEETARLFGKTDLLERLRNGRGRPAWAAPVGPGTATSDTPAEEPAEIGPGAYGGVVEARRREQAAQQANRLRDAASQQLQES